MQAVQLHVNLLRGTSLRTNQPCGHG